MFKGMFAVLVLVIFLVVFIRWFVKSERELKEGIPNEVPVHKASRWDAVGMGVILGPFAVLAIDMAYWNIKWSGWTQGTIVGCVIAVVVNIVVVLLIWVMWG